MSWYPVLELAAFLWAFALAGGLIAAFVYGPRDENSHTERTL
jgi:hypothetical protein